jgi:16S rRNA (guanine(527)-N(7))-methyltransferase RsmG
VNSADALERLAGGYGYGADSAEVRRLVGYLGLLEKWNARVNLTAATDWAAVGWLFEEALWAAAWYPRGAAQHLDIGSGAGFPAVPLKVLRPSMRLRLIESRSRRAAFLETAAAELGLAGVEVCCCRAEEYLGAPGTPGFDAVSWKGIRLSRRTWQLLVPRCGPETRLWLFHGPELPFADADAALKSLSLERREEFPRHPRRRLSVYRVARETP